MMPTKDQIVQMMNYDLKRRANRANMSLYINNVIESDVNKPKVSGNPVVPLNVSSNIHLAADEDVINALQERGWVDENSEW